MAEEFLRPDDLHLWRFSIISPLLHCVNDGAVLKEQIKTLSLQVYFTPDGREKQLCATTIRHWLSAIGQADSMDFEVKSAKIEAIPTYHRTYNKHSLNYVKHTLIGLWPDCCNSHAIWDTGTAINLAEALSIALLLSMRSVAIVHRIINRLSDHFEYPFFGDLWTGDFLHGPKVRSGVYTYKAYLHAIIDDATRYVVVARFPSRRRYSGAS